MQNNTPYVPRGLIRYWAWLDFVFGLAMALPPLALGFAKLIFALNHLIGGTASLPDFAPIQWLLVCICGIFILNWGVIRLLYPVGLLALIDSGIKLWACGLLIYVLSSLDGTKVLWLFVANGCLGAATQLGAAYWYRRHPQER